MMRASTSAIIGVVVHTSGVVGTTTTTSMQPSQRSSFHARGGGSSGGGYFDPFPPVATSTTVDSSAFEGNHRGGGSSPSGGWPNGGNHHSNNNNSSNTNNRYASSGNSNDRSNGGGWRREGGGSGGGRGRNTQQYEQPFHARRPQKAAEEEMFTASSTSHHPPSVSSPTPPPPGGIIVKKRRSTSDAPPTPPTPATPPTASATPIVVKRRTRTDSPPPVIPSSSPTTTTATPSDAPSYQDPPQAPPTPTSVLQTIKEVLERGPKEGMPLPAVARKLPDVVLETMEEGLKAFVQNTPGADEIMELTTAGTNVGGFAPANSTGTVLLKLLLHPSEMSVSQASLAAKMAVHNSNMASLSAPLAPPAPRFSVTGIHGAAQPGNVQPVLPPVTSLKATASVSLSPTSASSGASVPPPPTKGGAVPFIPPAPGAPAAARVLPVLDEEQERYAADCFAARLILDGTVSGQVVGLQKGGKLPYFISLEGLYTPSKPDPFLPLADNQRRGKPALDYRVGEGWRVVVDAIALESTSKLMRMTPGPHLPPMHAILKTWKSDIMEESGEGGVVRPARVLLRDNIVEKVLQDGAASVLDQYHVYALRSNSFPALTPIDSTEGCVEEYDLMRVARYVAVETITPFTELLPLVTPAITQHDLLHVILSAPELYQLDSPHNPTGVRYLMDPRYLPSELILTDEQRATCEIQCRQSAAEHRKGINRDKARAKYGLRRLKAVSHIRKYGVESFCDPYVLAYIVHDGMMAKGGGSYDISKLHEIDHSLSTNASSANSSGSSADSGAPVKRVVSVVSSENTSYTVPDGNRPGTFSQFHIPMNAFVKTTFPTADFFKKFIHLFSAEPNNFNYVATPKALVSGLEIGAAVGGVAHSGGTSQPSDVPKPYSMVQSHGSLSSLNLDSSRGGSGSVKGGSSSTLATRTSGIPTLQNSDPHLLPVDAMRTELHRLVGIMSAARRDYATPTTTTKDNTSSTNPIAEGYVPVLVIFLRLRGSKLMRSCLISGETVLSLVEGDPSRFVMSGDGTAVKAVL